MLIDERHLGQDASLCPCRPRSTRCWPRASIDFSAELAIVKAAAVIGKSFSDEAALLLAGQRDSSELESHLGALVRKQIIEADGGRFGGRRTFSFKHILLRDVAYQGILKARRADLHERYADWLEREAGERASEYQEIIGHHLGVRRQPVRAGADRRAATRAGRSRCRHLGASGSRALARGDIPGGQPARASRFAASGR